MWKSIRAAAFVSVLCLGATAGAWEGVQVGKNGRIKVDTGDTRVDVRPDGDVSVQTPGEDVDTQARRGLPGTGGAGEMVKTDAQITLEGTGQTQSITCENGQDVAIEGTDNTLRIRGECRQVIVKGVSNKVRVEAVGRVTVEGTSNRVTWERSLDGNRKPKVSTEGVDNKVTQAR